MRIKLDVMIFLIVALLSFNAVAQDFYQSGLEEKKQKNYAAAEKLFRLAVKEKNNFESRYELGVVQAYQKKYDEALETFAQLLKSSPNNYDVENRMAQIHIWKGDFAAGEKSVNKILQQNPDNEEANLLSARLFYYKNDLEKSKAVLLKILQKDQNNEEAAEFLKTVNAALKNKTGYKWQVDLGVSRSRLTRVSQPDWKRDFAKIHYLPSKNWDFSFLSERTERFHIVNSYFEVGTQYNKANDYVLYGNLGAADSYTFSPKKRVEIGGQKNLYQNKNHFLEALWATGSFQYSQYETNIVKKFDPGLEIKFFKDFTFDIKAILIHDQIKQNMHGWLTRLYWQTPYEPLVLNFGMAKAPETQNQQTVETVSKFTGFSLQLNDRFTLYGSYSRDDRYHSFINKTFSSAISLKF